MSRSHNYSYNKYRIKSGKTVKLKQILTFIGAICALSLSVCMYIALRNPTMYNNSLIQNDLIYPAYFTAALSYIAYIAAAIKSYRLKDKRKAKFKFFWIFGIVFTTIIILVIAIFIVKSEKHGRSKPEFKHKIYGQ